MQNFKTILDDGLALSDGLATQLQDRFEVRGASNRPPTRVPRNIARQSYWYRGTYSAGTLTTSATVATAISLVFQLSFLDLATSFTAVFDQYCIVAVKVKIRPLYSGSIGTAGPLHTVIDHDDAGGLLSVAQAQDYSTHMSTQGNIGQVRVVYPRLAIAAYSGAFTSFANQRSYVDCASPTVQHYGLKVLAEPSNGSSATYSIEVEMYLQFRDTH